MQKMLIRERNQKLYPKHAVYLSQLLHHRQSDAKCCWCAHALAFVSACACVYTCVTAKHRGMSEATMCLPPSPPTNTDTHTLSPSLTQTHTHQVCTYDHTLTGTSCGSASLNPTFRLTACAFVKRCRFSVLITKADAVLLLWGSICPAHRMCCMLHQSKLNMGERDLSSSGRSKPCCEAVCADTHSGASIQVRAHFDAKFRTVQCFRTGCCLAFLADDGNDLDIA